MKVTIINEPSEETYKKVYSYLYKIIKKQIQKGLQEAIIAGKTEEEFWEEYFKRDTEEKR